MSNTIKVIELLNNIANGEDVPKKIKYNGDIYNYNKELEDYKEEIGCRYLFAENFKRSDVSAFLNEKVEIIEDDKIEKLSCFDGNVAYIIQKMNELIDEVNKLNGKGE